MSLALVTTVRNERLALRPNLLYHRFLGVERAYVFDDGSSDGTVESVADLPFVRVRPMEAPIAFPPSAAPAWAAHVARQHTARQSLNAHAAMASARADGFAWLLHLDPDEFVALDANEARAGSLARAVEELPPEVEVAHLETAEVVQRPSGQSRGFGRETAFKIDRSVLRRPMYDPLRGLTWELQGFYAHHLGKALVRLSGDARPVSPHEFKSATGRALRTRTVGRLLHFHAHSFEDWVAKYRQLLGRPDHYVSGDLLERHKRVWRDLVTHPDYDVDRLRSYFDRWLAMGEDEIRRVGHGILEVRGLGDLLATLDAPPPASA